VVVVEPDVIKIRMVGDGGEARVLAAGSMSEKYVRDQAPSGSRRSIWFFVSASAGLLQWMKSGDVEKWTPSGPRPP
jgi:hypothetical protein